MMMVKKNNLEIESTERRERLQPTSGRVERTASGVEETGEKSTNFDEARKEGPLVVIDSNDNGDCRSGISTCPTE